MDDNDIGSTFEDIDNSDASDFDNSDSRETTDALEGSASVYDAVADLLMTGDTDPSKVKGSGKALGGVRDSDDEGSRTRQAPAQAPMEDPGYGLSGTQIRDVRDHAGDMIQKIDKAYQRLESMARDGSIGEQEFNDTAMQLGMQRGQFMRAYQESELDYYRHRDQQQRAMGWLNDQFPGAFDSPEKSQETLNEVTQYLTGQVGFSPDELRELEDPRAIAVVKKSLDATKENERLKQEVAVQKQMLKEYKKKFGANRKSASKSDQIGVRGTSSQEQQIEEVMKLLTGGK